MTAYRRPKQKGASYFFTVNCAQRQGNRLLVDNVGVLRQVFHKIKQAHPFGIDAIVILPEHVHCIWTLPEGDADFAIRWALIKAGFSRRISPGERCSESRIRRGERGIWQRRYWEHLIRDERDYRRHVAYIHWNPVKHGWVRRVRDWPYSSFQAYVRRGIVTADWAGEPDAVWDVGE